MSEYCKYHNIILSGFDNCPDCEISAYRAILIRIHKISLEAQESSKGHFCDARNAHQSIIGIIKELNKIMTKGNFKHDS